MTETWLTFNKTPDAKADLHLHTTASDGTWPAETLVKNLAEKGISLFAITDHDTTENLAEGAAMAKKYGLAFIPGVEINTTFDRHNYHILGLGIDPAAPALQAVLIRNKALLEAKDTECIVYLEQKYPQVTLAGYSQYANNRQRGGWKTLNYLIDQGICRDHKEFYRLFSGEANPFDTLTYVSPHDAIQAILSAGGIPVLAHPGATIYNLNYRDIVSIMIEAGIKGIECFHPENSAEVTEFCLSQCRIHHLRITGGSDCHGDFVLSRRLGHPDIPLSSLNLEGIRIFP